VKCDVHYAKTNLSKLIRQAEDGEEVIITRRGEDVVKLTPFSPKTVEFGTLKGKVGPIKDSLLFAMSEEEADNFLEGNW
jgi:prevent-host-death family protein